MTQINWRGRNNFRLLITLHSRRRLARVIEGTNASFHNSPLTDFTCFCYFNYLIPTLVSVYQDVKSGTNYSSRYAVYSHNLNLLYIIKILQIELPKHVPITFMCLNIKRCPLPVYSPIFMPATNLIPAKLRGQLPQMHNGYTTYCLRICPKKYK